MNLRDVVAGEPVGVFGQGAEALATEQYLGADPVKIFENHYLVEFEATLFDPSYGSNFIGGSGFETREKRLLEYEDTRIQFYGKAGSDGRDYFRSNAIGGTPEISAQILPQDLE